MRKDVLGRRLCLRGHRLSDTRTHSIHWRLQLRGPASQRGEHPSRSGRPEHGVSPRPHEKSHTILAVACRAASHVLHLSDDNAALAPWLQARPIRPQTQTLLPGFWPGLCGGRPTPLFLPLLIGRDHQNLEDTDVTDGFAKKHIHAHLLQPRRLFIHPQGLHLILVRK